MMLDYLILIVSMSVGVVLSLLMVFVSYYLVYRSVDVEKLSAYECGFHPFSDARDKFDIKFYLVSILFIIFDLEITFILPWILVLDNLNLDGFVNMVLFLSILTLGFVYEWFKGALDW
jgi:NADH:ubiquinone oxidoreductase subunit 3 (subunit A)